MGASFVVVHISLVSSKYRPDSSFEVYLSDVSVYPIQPSLTCLWVIGVYCTVTAAVFKTVAGWTEKPSPGYQGIPHLVGHLDFMSSSPVLVSLVAFPDFCCLLSQLFL